MLIAPWVTNSSAAAAEKLSRRAAASKARSALRGGRVCDMAVGEVVTGRNLLAAYRPCATRAASAAMPVQAASHLEIGKAFRL
ncbi:hypothetical protein GCM10007860_02520 [Chitiniphilus shinanonensis]|uniref:Uncharacterized protein n=1 Tax=Chitiniphilus shinanonensis TaxID=553088 RepID=A0ABQ6BNT1_9NEIS|nr:hypothetical protein GCM10007860_02520 [Chitiniphilus shinanonensis]